MTVLAAGLALLCWPRGISRLAPAGGSPPGGPVSGRFRESPAALVGGSAGGRAGRKAAGRVGGWATRWASGRVGGWATRWAGGRAGESATPCTRWVVGLICLAATAIWAAGGPAVATAATLVMATAAALTRTELRLRREQSDLAEMLVIVRALARELRSGAQPLAAVRAVSGARRGSSLRLLEQLATVLVTDRGHRTAHSPGGIERESEISGRLAAGWALSARYGVPWVGLIDALATDLADRVRATAARAAQVSGPRVSGYVLAVLPAFGLLLGAGMGADPVGILLGTSAGHLLLLTGCALTCAGLWWTARIVSG